MKYYKDNKNNVYAYDDTQLHLATDKTEITLEEVEDINKVKENEYKSTVEYKISEAKAYLANTDFYMTIDKYASLTEDKRLNLTRLREEARIIIRQLDGK